MDLRTRALMGASFWVIAARVVGIVVGFALAVAVARIYGKDALGFVTLLTSMTMLFGVVAEFGIGMFLMREFSASGAGAGRGYMARFYGRSVLIVLTFALVGCLAALPFFATMIPEFAQGRGAAVLSIAMLAFIARALVNLNTQALRGLMRIRAFAVMLSGPPVVNLIGVLVLAVIGAGFVPRPLLPAVSYAFALAVVALISTIFIRSDIMARDSRGTHDPADIPPAPRIARAGFAFFMTSFMSLVVSQGSVIVAGYFLTSADLGLYSVAVKISTLAAFALASINMVAEPRFAQLRARGDEEELRLLAKRTTTLVFWSTAPILAGILLLAPWLVRVAFGPEYLPAVPALLILTGGYFINSFGGVSNYFLNMTGGQKVLASIVTLSAVMTVVLSILLIPPFGITGAAMAMGGSIAIWNIATLLAVRKRDGIWLCYMPFTGRRG